MPDFKRTSAVGYIKKEEESNGAVISNENGGRDKD